MRDGNVAENMNVCRFVAPEGIPMRPTICSTSFSNPMSSMQSASSSASCRTPSSVTTLRCTMSTRRPGVAINKSQPLDRSSFAWMKKLWPPYLPEG